MIAWMTYALLVSGLLVVAGHLLEDVAANRGLQRRGVWMAVLFLSAVVPLATTPVATPLPELGTMTTMVPDVAIQPPPVNEPTLNAVAAWGWLALSTAWLSVAGTVLVVIGVARRRWKKDRLFNRDVLVSEAFGPALVGVRKADIVIPRWVFGLSERDTQIVVTHEDEHRRSRDHMTLLAGALATGIMAWNPLVWWALHQLRRTVELDCDQRVLGHGIPAARYGRVLLDISTGQSGSWGFVPGMVHPKSTLERRLRAMGKRKTGNSTGWIWFSAIAGCALVFAACETPAPTGVRNAMDSAFEARLRAREVRDQEEEGLTLTQEVEARAAEGAKGKPIVFVDGIRVFDLENTLELLDPDEIDRIEIIKGAAAEGIFGSAAQNGVIQIYRRMTGAEATPELEVASTLRRRELAIRETQKQVQLRANALSQRLLEVRERTVTLQQDLSEGLQDRSQESQDRTLELIRSKALSEEIQELAGSITRIGGGIGETQARISEQAREVARHSTAGLEQALVHLEAELHQARTSMSEVEWDRLRRSQMELRTQIEAVRQRASRQNPQ